MEVIDFITKKMWSIVLIIYVAMFLETKKGFSFALANVARVDGVEEANNDVALNQTQTPIRAVVMHKLLSLHRVAKI